MAPLLRWQCCFPCDPAGPAPDAAGRPRFYARFCPWMTWARSPGDWWGWYCEPCQSFVEDKVHFLGDKHRRSVGQAIAAGGVPDRRTWSGGGHLWKEVVPRPTLHQYPNWLCELPL